MRKTEKEYSKLMIKYAKLGMPPKVFIDSLIPVFVEGIKLSSFQDYQWKIKGAKKIFIFSKELEKDFGIYLAEGFFEDGGSMYFLFKDDKLHAEVEKLKEEENYSKKLMNLMGETSKIPNCCLEKQLKFAREKIEGSELAYVDLLKYNLIDKRSYFSIGFVPCSPSCNQASKIGEKITNSMPNKFLRMLWDANLLCNLNISLNYDTDWNFFTNKLNDEAMKMAHKRV